MQEKEYLPYVNKSEHLKGHYFQKEMFLHLKAKALKYDYKLIFALQEERSILGIFCWRSISQFGLPYIWTLIGIIPLFFEIYHLPYLLVFSSLSSLFIVYPLKNKYKRKRPYQRFKGIEPLKRKKDYGFPSGHTYFATANAFSIFFCYNVLYFLPVAIIIGLLVAYSRVYLGVHYFTDVIFGFLLGLFGALIVSFFFPYIMILHILTVNA